MPERVHIRFDGEPITSKPAPVSTAPRQFQQGKKRKLDDRIDRAPEARTKPFYDPQANGTRLNSTHINSSKTKASPVTRDASEPKGKPASGPLAKKRQELLPIRQALPIWAHASDIRQALRGPHKDVLLLVGETGSGKSTQVPQFLLSEPWCTGQIAITQPRRVAAISLARRVADEMGSTLGSSSPGSKVGYSVRFDQSVSPSTRIKFLTEGMLLQEMLRDPWLKQYSVVVVDEVHERSVNVDLVLGFLRNIVTGDKKGRGGKPLKVVVMSATADIEGLQRFFEDGYRLSSQHSSSNGTTAATNGTEDSESSWSGISSSSEDEAPKSITPRKELSNGVEPKNGSPAASISQCHIEGRQYPVKTMYLPEPTQDFVEAALKSIFQIHYKEPVPGDILVFLTGQDTVEGLEKLVKEYALGMGPEVPKIITLPLFAALPQHLQQRVFAPAPPKTRKVILSTNIAETSVTVPGVRFVVDCGKAKIKQFRNRLGLDSLLVKPISQSAAIQRQGRAGREAPGQCYRLYTEKDYNTLEKNTTPEILRCDLSAALLVMKARGIDDVLNFPFLSRPPREALEKALLQLLQLGALTEAGEISDIGRTIAKLPLTPTLGRCLVEAAKPERGCLTEMIDIIAALSVENVFLNLVTEEKREEAEAARRTLYRREGDHMTFLATVQGYAEEKSDRKAWAERHYVSHRAMQNVMDIRKQLRGLCGQLSLPIADTEKSSEELTTSILHSLLRGFAANTARLMPDGSYRTLSGNQTIAIHPSSVLFGKKVEAIVFSESVFTSRSYARGVSAVRLDWVAGVLAGADG
ncbi:Salivary acidic proline-rich phosphoprotein 1/2 [Coniosporium tulheliwenetii]|uniref:Salivary acidic proline-rich phosphoprotein 1/2 n=1 Tax=Coniosporium tulheliwenetii TaxID=3383036 RepID=A0ACC2ZI51_9PEZI|nr:Salivary acidic proline-rich phosphoprotein 1/2 [Cladosporium sp. JES 115]